MEISILVIMVLTLASPKFPGVFDKEPSFETEKKLDFQKSISS
jgi:hypothetical protein